MAINIIQHFGSVVRKHREKQGISQLELGERAHIDLSTVNRLERGIGNLTLRNAFKIAKALHIPFYKFFLIDRDVKKQERRGELTEEPIDSQISD